MRHLLHICWLSVALLLGTGCDVIPINIPLEDGGATDIALASRDAGWGADEGQSGPDGGIPPPWGDSGMADAASAVDAAGDAVLDGMGDGWTDGWTLDGGGEGVGDATSMDGGTDGTPSLDGGSSDGAVGE